MDGALRRPDVAPLERESADDCEKDGGPAQ